MDNSKFTGAIDTVEARALLQEYLDSLAQWLEKQLLDCKPEKCKLPRLRQITINKSTHDLTKDLPDALT